MMNELVRVFPQTFSSSDLTPILTETAGKGRAEDQPGIACAGLITAMT